MEEQDTKEQCGLVGNEDITEYIESKMTQSTNDFVNENAFSDLISQYFGSITNDANLDNDITDNTTNCATTGETLESYGKTELQTGVNGIGIEGNNIDNAYNVINGVTGTITNLNGNVIEGTGESGINSVNEALLDNGTGMPKVEVNISGVSKEIIDNITGGEVLADNIGEEVGTTGESNEEIVQEAKIDTTFKLAKTNLPAKVGFWTKVRNFLFYDSNTTMYNGYSNKASGGVFSKLQNFFSFKK